MADAAATHTSYMTHGCDSLADIHWHCMWCVQLEERAAREAAAAAAKEDGQAKGPAKEAAAAKVPSPAAPVAKVSSIPSIESCHFSFAAASLSPRTMQQTSLLPALDPMCKSQYSFPCCVVFKAPRCLLPHRINSAQLSCTVHQLQTAVAEAKKAPKNKGKGPVNGVEKKAQREKAAAKKVQEAAAVGRS